MRRRRRRARLGAPARRGVGTRRLRAPGAGEPRSRVAARPVAGAPVPDRRRARPRRRPPRAHLQRRSRAHARRRRRTTCAASSSTCGSGRRRERRRARHGVRGPASLDEIPGYLADIRHGRPTPRAVLDEITENYRAIGGSSPLLAVTERQVDALAAELGRRVPVLPRDAPLGARGSRTSSATWSTTASLAR